MPRLVQINVTAGWGSTGRIASEIGQTAVDAGWESWIAYGREKNGGDRRSAIDGSRLIKIGSDLDQKVHGLATRLLDRHGLASKRATRKLVAQLRQISPDIIHLHNIHGYYIHYPTLFKYLKEWGGPVVWTLHDCWSFTGHCAHFVSADCYKWRSCCYSCPLKKKYPISIFLDNSKINYQEKRNYFTSVADKMTLIPVSLWLSDLVSQSFLRGSRTVMIHNGIDISVFTPCHESKRNMVVGVASVWDNQKGLSDFIELRKILPDDIGITLVGLTQDQIEALPAGIEGVARTNSVQELASLYSRAIAFVNPTWEDNFPTVNIEALACGTPVITYKTGGSPEAIDENTGIVVEQGDVNGLANAVETIRNSTDRYTPSQCRQRAVDHFDKKDRYGEYIMLYESLLTENS